MESTWQRTWHVASTQYKLTYTTNNMKGSWQVSSRDEHVDSTSKGWKKLQHVVVVVSKKEGVINSDDDVEPEVKDSNGIFQVEKRGKVFQLEYLSEGTAAEKGELPCNKAMAV